MVPVLISVYKRKYHFFRLIDSLLMNTESTETTLYIVSDGPRNDEETILINDIRDEIRRIKGFLEVIPIFRDKNLGSHLSVSNAIDFVFQRSARLIFIEDDNVVSNNFLAYQNSALEYYESNKSIFSISGYNFPIKIKDQNQKGVYFFKGFSAWGVGLWKDRWDNISFNWENCGSLEYLKQHEYAIKKELGESVFNTIKKMHFHRVNYVDAIICYHCFLNNVVSVFPEITKVRNYGHDGLGEHGGKTNVYLYQELDYDNKIFVFPQNIIQDLEIKNKVIKYFKLSFKSKMLIFLRSIYHSINRFHF